MRPEKCYPLELKPQLFWARKGVRANALFTTILLYPTIPIFSLCFGDTFTTIILICQVFFRITAKKAKHTDCFPRVEGSHDLFVVVTLCPAQPQWDLSLRSWVALRDTISSSHSVRRDPG